MEELILASASPRRADILRMMGLRFRIVPSRISEELDGPLPPADHVRLISSRKALAVSAGNAASIILGADTVVALGNEILEKPADPADARRMLERLSGKTHRVYTGITLVPPGGRPVLSDVASTDVTVRALGTEEIGAYVATGEPMDKAGAYAAQGRAAVFIESISGCFFNVVGLPLALCWTMLGKLLGHTPWSLVSEPPASGGLFTPPDSPVL